MVYLGDADAFVSGLTSNTRTSSAPRCKSSTPARACAKPRHVLLVVKEKVYVFTDATVNIDPSARTLPRSPSWQRMKAKAFGWSRGSRCSPFELWQHASFALRQSA